MTICTDRPRSHKIISASSRIRTWGFSQAFGKENTIKAVRERMTAGNKTAGAAKGPSDILPEMAISHTDMTAIDKNIATTLNI
ncbi:MAG: hypothetical protein JST76_12740, partial [Bacteroidetes bacterium]|nr:hypothetical protein [Bacteroidota bacterium]